MKLFYTSECSTSLLVLQCHCGSGRPTWSRRTSKIRTSSCRSERQTGSSGCWWGRWSGRWLEESTLRRRRSWWPPWRHDVPSVEYRRCTRQQQNTAVLADRLSDWPSDCDDVHSTQCPMEELRSNLFGCIFSIQAAPLSLWRYVTTTVAQPVWRTITSDSELFHGTLFQVAQIHSFFVGSPGISTALKYSRVRVSTDVAL